jgi:hypothetical protein
MILIKMWFRQQCRLGMIIGFAMVEGNIDRSRNRIIPIVEITQILILEFK